jgi:hypothetical protein
MVRPNILFDRTGSAATPEAVSERIAGFADSYKEAMHDTIQNSRVLDRNGRVFVECAARLLSSFKMTRSGPFRGVGIAQDGRVELEEILQDCWNGIGRHLIEIKGSIREGIEAGYSRDRYLLQLSEPERQNLIAEIWSMTKELLPFTMGETSYGLVGASKILFAVLPEIVLPLDNSQWLKVFKTVDLGDVIRWMVSDIRLWEMTTHRNLNEMDSSNRLTTLPSVYNVMAMDARP